MTTQRRRGFRGGSRRRRTGRDVWVNHDLNEIPLVNGIGNKDLLIPAPDFMTFDTTINSVILEDIHFSYDSLAPAGLRRFAIGLVVLKENLGSANMPVILQDGVGPPWLGMLHAAGNISGVAPQNINLTPNGPVIFKAKRRFRENDSTLYLVFQSVSPAADTAPLLSGIIRILIHIP